MTITTIFENEKQDFAVSGDMVCIREYEQGTGKVTECIWLHRNTFEEMVQEYHKYRSEGYSKIE